jgi:hypothetical protein
MSGSACSSSSRKSSRRRRGIGSNEGKR